MTIRATILQILPALNAGGVERGTIEINQAIVKEGWRSFVISSGGQLVPHISYGGGEHITMPVETKHYFKMRANAKKLAEFIKKNDVSIIHARSRAPAWSAYWAAQATGVPFMTTFHGVYNTNGGFLKRRYNEVMTKGDRIIAVSQFVYEHILKHYECDANKIRVIHRGADIAVFNPEKVVADRMMKLAQDWRIPDDHPPLILMPGRITRWKGHELLIEALAKLPHRNFFCLMVGDDSGHEDYREHLEQMITEHKLEGHVRIAANTPLMTEAYALADIVVAPSIEPEAFGRVPVEAQAMGKLVIAAGHGGAMETIVPGETGFLFTPASIDELSQAIEFVLKLDNETREAIGQRAMEHVKQHFTADHMREKTIRVYKELLKA